MGIYTHSYSPYLTVSCLVHFCIPQRTQQSALSIRECQKIFENWNVHSQLAC